jgi:hypothetical protein
MGKMIEIFSGDEIEYIDIVLGIESINTFSM